MGTVVCIARCFLSSSQSGKTSLTARIVVWHDHSSTCMIHWYWLSQTTYKICPYYFICVQKTTYKSISAVAVSTNYWYLCFLCAFWSLLLQKLPDQESLVTRFSTHQPLNELLKHTSSAYQLVYSYSGCCSGGILGLLLIQSWRSPGSTLSWRCLGEGLVSHHLSRLSMIFPRESPLLSLLLGKPKQLLLKFCGEAHRHSPNTQLHHLYNYRPNKFHPSVTFII